MQIMANYSKINKCLEGITKKVDLQINKLEFSRQFKSNTINLVNSNQIVQSKTSIDGSNMVALTNVNLN